MLIAGLCFVAICGGAWGFSELFYSSRSAFINAMNMWLPIFLLIMIAGMVISMLWIKALSKKKSVGLTIFIYALYIALESVAFGYIFALVRWTFTDDKALQYLALAFGVTGGIFLIAAGMSKLLSIKGAFSFMRLMAACGMAVGILSIVSLVLLIVNACAPSVMGLSAQSGIFFGIMLGLSVIVFGYMVIDMWSITKSEEFMNYMGLEGEVPSSYVWYCGYKLLVDLLNVLLIVLWFIIRFGSRD